MVACLPRITYVLNLFVNVTLIRCCPYKIFELWDDISECVTYYQDILVYEFFA
jgi:hypothetical protein